MMAGLDLYFLNRATMLNVTSSQQLHDVFSAPASGLTPITPVLQHVLEAKKAIALERKLLVVIATDGAPTNPQGQVDTASLRRVLMARNTDKVFVTFLACTDDDSTMDYLNKWDKYVPPHRGCATTGRHRERKAIVLTSLPRLLCCCLLPPSLALREIPNLDVVDDYHSERAEVLKAQGPSSLTRTRIQLGSSLRTLRLLTLSMCFLSLSFFKAPASSFRLVTTS